MKWDRHVYFIFDPFTQLIKIGRSTRPRLRLEALRISYHDSLQLIWSSPDFTESEMHKKWNAFRVGYPPSYYFVRNNFYCHQEYLEGRTEWFLAKPIVGWLCQESDRYLPLLRDLNRFSAIDFRLVSKLDCGEVPS